MRRVEVQGQCGEVYRHYSKHVHAFQCWQIFMKGYKPRLFKPMATVIEAMSQRICAGWIGHPDPTSITVL